MLPRAAGVPGRGARYPVASAPGAAIAVHDSKDPRRPRLAFGADDWRAFPGQVKDGRLA